MPNVDAPIHGLTLDRRGQLRPYYLPRGNGLGDIRHVSGEFFLSVQKLWRERGDEILQRVADKFPELLFMGMIKLSQVTKIEVGQPNEFAGLGSKQQAVIDSLRKGLGRKRVSCSKSSSRTWRSCKRSENRISASRRLP